MLGGSWQKIGRGGQNIEIDLVMYLRIEWGDVYGMAEELSFPIFWFYFVLFCLVFFFWLFCPDNWGFSARQLGFGPLP